MDVGDLQMRPRLGEPGRGTVDPLPQASPQLPESWQEPLCNCDARAESQNCHRSLCKPIFTSLSVAHQRRT